MVFFFFFFSSNPRAVWGRKLLHSNLFASGAQGAYALRARCHLSRPDQPVPGHVYGRIWLTISRDTLGGGQVGRSGRAILLRSWAIAPAWGWIPRMDAHLLSGEHVSLVRRPAARSCSRSVPLRSPTKVLAACGLLAGNSNSRGEDTLGPRSLLFSSSAKRIGSPP